MSVVGFLRIFRAHSAPLTVLPVIIIPLMAGVKDVVHLLTLWVLTTIMHWMSFGHNSVLDWERGWDRKDPYKKHFPLNTGEVDPVTASKVINWGLSGIVALLVVFMLVNAKRPELAVASFVIALQLGHAYDDGLDKITVWKWVPVFGYGYFTTLGFWFVYFDTLTDFGFWYTLSVGIIVEYQILYEGELKDFETEEANLFRVLGARVENGTLILTPPLVLLFLARAPLVFTVMLGLSSYCRWVGGISFTTYIMMIIYYCAFSLLVLYFLVQLHLPRRRYDRNRELRNMATEEMVSYFLLFSFLFPKAPLAVPVLLLYSVGWLAFFNRVQWGTVVRPQV